ncbi:MAG: cadmium-translocating P-type ATPase [Micrococcales bacterium]|nr:cadmium-translocating P-type ATPase [Micrococcales bacterium]
MSRYWFVLVSLASVLGGLAFDFANQPLMAKVSWAIGAAIGFYFSTRWLVLAIRKKALGSDVLALISILATAVTNEWLAASLISLMLSTGQALERWAEGRSSKHLDALLARAPQSAHLVDASGDIEDVDIKTVLVGSRVLVRSGEVVPFDGLVESDALFDESALTGESLPVWRTANSKVDSGVLNVAESVIIKTTSTSEDSTYTNLIRLVANAKSQASQGVRLANVWASRFVPLALGMALITYLITQDIRQAVSVIVAATPCPLILAVPVALVSGISRAAQRGVIIKSGESIERLANAEVVLLDKTGTLTEGGPRITAESFAEGSDPDEVLRLGASLDQESSNIVAKAVVGLAKAKGLKLERPVSVLEAPGHGLCGIIGGHKVSIGQPKLPLPGWVKLTNALLIEIRIDDVAVGFLGLDDPLRKEAAGTVSALDKLGVKRVLLVSGDRHETVKAIADELGIKEYFAECTPTQKLDILNAELKATGGSVVVVGDGINDAPALASADVGVAMGARGNTAASQAAKVVIVEDSIRRLVDAIEVSKVSKRRALQASAIGMGLAIIAMGFAAFGLLNPNQAALIQEFIDAAAIIWALIPSLKNSQQEL